MNSFFVVLTGVLFSALRLAILVFILVVIIKHLKK